MKSEIAQSVTDAVQNPRIAAGVSTVTAGAGLSDKLGLIPWNDVALAVGALLSLVLIFTNLAKLGMEFYSWRTQVNILKRKEKERLAERSQRLKNGDPLRRKHDS